MSLQILTLELDGITAGDYLSWCRDPDPPAFGFALRMICVDADPLGDTITAILDWDQDAPAPPAAARAAGLPLPTGVRLDLAMPTYSLPPSPPPAASDFGDAIVGTGARQ